MPTLAQNLRSYVDKSKSAPQQAPPVEQKPGKPAEKPAPQGGGLAQNLRNFVNTAKQQPTQMETQPAEPSVIDTVRAENELYQDSLSRKVQEIKDYDPEKYVMRMGEHLRTSEDLEHTPISNEKRKMHVPQGEFTGEIITQPGQITENFHSDEFACKGTGELKVSADLVNQLEELRKAVGQPIRITSGYRSPEHNATIPGAAENSVHMTGRAADIQIPGMSVEEMSRLAREFFPVVHDNYSSHIHVEI